MLLFVYGYLGIYHLLLFIKRPKERYNLFFGGFGLFISIYNYTRSNAIYEYILDPLIVIKIEHSIFYFLSAFRITEAVKESGELTDDYTLLRIGYKL